MGTRAQCKMVARNTAGAVLSSATVEVRKPGTSTKITETIYGHHTDHVILTNPIAADAQGRVEFWLARPKRVDLLVTDGASSRTLFDVDVLPTAEHLDTIPGFNHADLPAPGLAGRIARVLDKARGLWIDATTAWVSLFHEAVNAQEHGVLPANSAATNATNLAAAFAAGRRVLVPPGAYPIAGFTIPAGNTLELLPGARLLPTGSIELQNSRSRLIGHSGSVPTTSDSDDTIKDVVWAGAAGGIMLRIGTSASPVGVQVKGVRFDGGGIADIVGCETGGGPFTGPAWLLVQEVTFTRIKDGLRIRGGTQQCRYRDIALRNQTKSTGIGIEVAMADATQPAITAQWFRDCTVEGFDRDVVLGGAFGGGSLVSFAGCVIEDFTTVALDAVSGGPYEVDDCFLEGGAGQTLIRLGTTTLYPQLTRIHHSTLQTGLDGKLIEGIAWRWLKVHHNYLDGAQAFLNTGGGPYRVGGEWRANMPLTSAVTSEVPDKTGFDFVEEHLPLLPDGTPDGTRFARVIRESSFFDLKAGKAIGLRALLDATSGANRNVEGLILRAKYWDGAASANADAQLLVAVLGNNHYQAKLVVGGITRWIYEHQGFSVQRTKIGDNSHRFHIPVYATASLPAPGSTEDGSILLEDAGAGDRNLIIYAGGQRFRIDGGAAF